MDITFRNKRLASLCNTSQKAERELGPQGAKKLRARLSDLDAARRLGDVVYGRPHPLTEDRRGQFAFDLDGGRRLVLESTDPDAVLPEGGVDWPNVTAIVIVEIGGYHV